MRPSGKFFLLPALACLLTGQAFASTLPVASLRVQSADTARVGEALPVTVSALDADGEIKDDYIGTVYFVVKGDPESKIPANKAQGYTLRSDEKGVHAFADGIVFSQPGTAEVIAIDLDNENVQGSRMVTVTRDPCADASVLISILTPKDGSQVAVPKVSVGGATKANCAAQLLLNGARVGAVTADAKGAYAADVPGLKEGENLVTALLGNGNKSSVRVDYVVEKVAITSPADGGEVADACNAVAGTTNAGASVAVSVNGVPAGSATADGSGAWTLDACGFRKGSNLVAATTKGGVRASVTARLDYSIVITSPRAGDRLASSTGTVTGRTGPNAPVSVRIGSKDVCWGVSDAKGDFSIPDCAFPSCDATIVADRRDAQGKTLATSAPVRFKPLPPGNVCEQVKFTCLKGDRSDGRATLDFCVAPDTEAVANFRVLTGASCEALSGSVDTLPKGKIYGPDWKNYRWGVPAPSGPLAVKVLALDPAGKPTGLPSECLVLDDGACEIGAIAGVRSTADVQALRSTLAWDRNADSASYNLYVRPENGGPLAFVENVANPPYAVRMSPDRVKFADFVVRGVCRKGAQASPDLANATKVQTGPGALLAVAVLALGGALVVARRMAAKAR